MRLIDRTYRGERHDETKMYQLHALSVTDMQESHCIDPNGRSNEG